MNMTQASFDEGKSKNSAGARSQRTSRSKVDGKKRFKKLKIIKRNVETSEEAINEQIKRDKDIDLDKIKKFFKNVINE